MSKKKEKLTPYPIIPDLDSSVSGGHCMLPKPSPSPQMICPNWQTCKKKCSAKEKHEYSPTGCNKYPENDECPSCIEYVKPSPAKDKVCTREGGECSYHAHTNLGLELCRPCPDFKASQPEPMPLIEGWDLDKRLDDFNTIAIHLDADGETSRAKAVRYLIERCKRAESPNKVQQVRKAFAESLPEDELVKLYCSNNGWEYGDNEDYDLAVETVKWFLAHLRAMAKGGRKKMIPKAWCKICGSWVHVYKGRFVPHGDSLGSCSGSGRKVVVKESSR